jgi:hypothetical protein
VCVCVCGKKNDVDTDGEDDLARHVHGEEGVHGHGLSRAIDRSDRQRRALREPISFDM